MSTPLNDEGSNSQEGKPEVNSARSRLSGALSTAERFVDKYAGDDFPLSPHKRLQSLDSPFPSPTKSPRGVRRRRKKPIALNTAFHHTVVMKLFDRSLDLAQFAEDTSLYPVCRAWMKNEPHNTNMAPRLRTPTPEPDPLEADGGSGGDEGNNDEDSTEKDVEKDIYKLPVPEPLATNAFNEEESIRVPLVPAQAMDKSFEVTDNPDAPDINQLLTEHMVKWLQVRKNWRDAANSNEKRYADSMKILTEMFEK